MSSFHVHIIITTGYLENYGQDKQEIILLHVYNSIDHVTQYSDDDSEGEIPFLQIRYFGRHGLNFSCPVLTPHKNYIIIGH